MNTAQFEITPSAADMLSARFRSLWLSKPFFAYVVVVGTAGLVGCIGQNFGGSDDFWTAWGLISLALLSSPFALVLGQHNRRTRMFPPGTSHYNLTPEGFLATSEDAEAKLKWGIFSRVEETSKYIFLFLKSGETLVLHKALVKGATVDDIRTVLRTSGVPNQRWKE